MALSFLLAASLATAAAVAGPAAASTAPATGCASRDGVEAVRRAVPADRAALRKRFDAEHAAARDARSRSCSAAVAAEAARLDGDKARTLQMLDDIVAGHPSLAGDLRPRRALLQAELGRVDDARRELALVDVRATESRARIELSIADATNNGLQAKALLRRLAPRDAGALGRLCRDHDDGDACHDLLVRHPRSDEARRLEQEADAGNGRALVRTASWPPASAAARLRALTGAARPHRAVAEGRAWRDAHRTTAAGDGHMLVAAALGEALLRTGDVAGAVVVTDGFEVRGDVDSGHELVAFDFDAARVHAKALSRAGRVDDAAAVWRTIVDASRWGAVDRRDVAAEAAFFAAFTLVEVDRVDDALAALVAARSHTSAAPTSTWETQRAWYESLLRLTSKNDARAALPILDALVAGNDREVRKFRYWRARALQALERRDEAAAVLRALVVDDPLDWYGQLARRDLARPALAGAVVAPDALAAIALREALDDDATMTRLLWELGFDDEARARCRARAQRAVGRPSLADIGVCHLVDDPTSGWRRGALFLPRVTGDALPTMPAWRVSYAAPWTRAVDDVAAVAGVPRSFVWAIMRTESGFDPDAVSIAGARGALQLLPSVARGVASHAGLPPTLADRLDDPHVAVALGGRLLGLLAREHGSLLVAAAAYNGAPENAAAWAKRFGALPADVFVERIPFKEARDYVKRVLAVEAVYRALDDGSGVTLTLPTTIAPAASPTLFPYLE